MAYRYAILVLAGFFFLSPINTNNPDHKKDAILCARGVCGSVIVEIVESDAADIFGDDGEQGDYASVDNSDADEGDDEGDEVLEEHHEADAESVVVNQESGWAYVGDSEEKDEVDNDALEFCPDDNIDSVKASVAKQASHVSARVLSVLIDITPEQQRYKHWTGFSYKPDEFYCIINEVKALPGAMVELPTPIDNRIVLIYYSRFENGRESSKKYTYVLGSGRDKIVVQFDWKRKQRLFVDDETAIFELLEELI